MGSNGQRAAGHRLGHNHIPRQPRPGQVEKRPSGSTQARPSEVRLAVESGGGGLASGVLVALVVLWSSRDCALTTGLGLAGDVGGKVLIWTAGAPPTTLLPRHLAGCGGGGGGGGSSPPSMAYHFALESCHECVAATW